MERLSESKTGRNAALIENSFGNIAKTQQCQYYFPMEKGIPGTELRLARTSLGLSLAEAASKTGLTNSIISRIENGKVKEPSPSAIKALCSLYGLRVSRLYALYGWLANEQEADGVLFERVNELDSSDIAFVQQTIDYLANSRKGQKQ